MKVSDMNNWELDYWSAIALGASPERKPKENELITGLPFLHCLGNPDHFRIVNAASVSTIWRPSTSWIDAGVLIRSMAQSGSLTIEHRPLEEAACSYGQWRAEAGDLCVALVRLFVMNAFGLHVNEAPAQVS